MIKELKPWWCHLSDNQHFSEFILFLHDQGTEAAISLPETNKAIRY